MFASTFENRERMTVDVRRSTRIGRLASALLVAGVSVLLALAGPASATDTFPGTTIAGTGSTTGSNSGFTGQTGEPTTFGGGNLNTFWYSWTAPASGRATFGTCNPTGNTFGNFDTTLQAFTGGAVNTLTTITSNDDTTGCNVTPNANYGSTSSFVATAGVTYRLQVDGYGSSTGNFNFHYGMAGITVAVVDDTALEGGAGGSFTIRLNSVPVGNVVVTIGSSPQCTFTPTTRTFTNANWATPQTITFNAINDIVQEGPHTCSPASITASGGAYGGITATPPVLNVIDNDIATFSIAKTVDTAAIAAPGTVSYTITVVNTSGVTMTGTSLTDTLTLGAAARTLTSGPTGPSGDGGVVGQLNVGETWTWTATYAVTQADFDSTGDLTNLATFDTAQTLPSNSAPATTTLTRTPSFTIAKSANDTTDVVAGQTLTYTYVVTNNGNITIDGISIADVHGGSGPAPVPAGETLTGDVAPLADSTDATPGNGIWSVLRPGDSVTFTGTYLVTQVDVDTL